jgi:hypothetical protein
MLNPKDSCVPTDYFDRLATLAMIVHVKISTENTCMRNNSQIPLRKSAIEQTLDRAVQRVYETYGSDLTRFFAAIQKQRTQQLQEAAEVREEAPRPISDQAR